MILFGHWLEQEQRGHPQKMVAATRVWCYCVCVQVSYVVKYYVMGTIICFFTSRYLSKHEEFLPLEVALMEHVLEVIGNNVTLTQMRGVINTNPLFRVNTSYKEMFHLRHMLNVMPLFISYDRDHPSML